MSKVFSALAVSVDGYITGRDPGPGRGLGDGATLFDWYFDGDVPSRVFDSFRLCEPSARFFDAVAGRVGASIAGRNTYEDSSRFGDDGTPHPAAPLFVLSHRPAPQMAGRQRLITTGLADAVAAARDAADGKDIALMGGVLVTEALQAGLVDELILHQVPVLLGAGRPYFHSQPEHIQRRGRSPRPWCPAARRRPGRRARGCSPPPARTQHSSWSTRSLLRRGIEPIAAPRARAITPPPKARVTPSGAEQRPAGGLRRRYR